MKNTNNIYFYLIIIIVLSIVIGLSSTLSPMANQYIGVDSSVFIYTAKQIMNNNVPYLHTFDHKGPLIYTINYLGLIIGNNNTIGIWLLEILTIIITLIILFKVAELITQDNKKALLVTFLSAITLIRFFDEGNLTEEYALPFISFALYIFIKYFKDINIINWKNSFITGLCLGAVLLLRPNMITLWIVYYPCLAIKLLMNKEYKKLLVLFIFSILGVVAFTLPFVIYLVIKSAFLDFINSYIIFNFRYSSSGTTNIIAVAKAYLLRDKSLILALFSCLIIKSHSKEDFWIDICSFAFLLLSFFIVIMPRNIYLHYGIILMPCIIVPIAKIVKELKNKEILISLIIFVTVIIRLQHYRKY